MARREKWYCSITQNGRAILIHFPMPCSSFAVVFVMWWTTTQTLRMGLSLSIASECPSYLELFRDLPTMLHHHQLEQREAFSIWWKARPLFFIPCIFFIRKIWLKRISCPVFLLDHRPLKQCNCNVCLQNSHLFWHQKRLCLRSDFRQRFLWDKKLSCLISRASFSISSFFHCLIYCHFLTNFSYKTKPFSRH